MKSITYKNAVVWKGSVREVTAEIRRLTSFYPRLIDLIHARLH